MESLEIEKYYQWTTPQRSGKVEIYLAEDDNQIYFKSGRFVQKDMFDSSLMEITESEYNQKNRESTVAPPQPPQTIEEWESKLGNSEYNPTVTPSPIKKQSPIALILEKQKKSNKETIHIDYEINMPNPKAIEFMIMMFDEDEVLDEMADYIINQISQDDFKKKIKESIKNRI